VKAWSHSIAPATIPDGVLKSERARRNASKRTSHSGGVYWKRHNPDTTRCRCERCMSRRQGAQELPASNFPGSRGRKLR
jgi:hypothetical protein